MLKKSIILIALIVFMFTGFAQTLDDAGSKYNQANDLFKAKNYSASIPLYEDAVIICTDLGTEGNDLKASIQTNLNNAYYKNGLTLYKAKKFDEAIADLQKSRDLATELGNTSLAKKSNTYVSKVMTTKGGTLLKSKKEDAALAEYDKALKVDPNSYGAYYGKGLVYKTQNNMDQMMAMMDKVIELGETNPKAAKTVQKAKSNAYTALFNEGAKEIQKDHGELAAKYITDSFKYGEGTSDSYYYLSLAYQKTSDWDAGIEAANKALELKDGDKSNIYFTVGQLNEGKGDAAAACAAYKNVSGGPNVDAAKYQMTQVLKCS